MTFDPKQVPHPELEDLIAYLDGALVDADEEGMELHLGGCDRCTALAVRAGELADLWQQWTAATHRTLEQQLHVDSALERIERDAHDGATRARLREWRNRWGGAAEAAVHAVWSATSAGTRIAANAVDTLLRPGTPWRMAPVEAFGGAWGEADESAEEIVLATESRRAGSPTASIELRGGMRPGIVVRIDDLATGTPPPLVVLVPETDEAREVRVAASEFVSGSATCVAHFRDITPGPYLLLLEPLVASDADDV